MGGLGASKHQMSQHVARQGLITGCQRMAGIAVLVACQRIWCVVAHPFCFQPGFQSSTHLVITLPALIRQQVFVEWSQKHEDTISAVLEYINRPLEKAPLE